MTREIRHEPLFTRRQILQTASILAAGSTLGLGGCVTRRPTTLGRRSPLRLPPVRVSEDRLIRQMVGLRPFRPSGFVVRAQPFGDKLLVHNYGHGGAGVTLSWGTAHLAVEEVLASGRRGPTAVLGCGVVGLSTARLLQRKGFEVMIYARDLPPETTSNVAGASWYPGLVVRSERRTPAFGDAELTPLKGQLEVLLPQPEVEYAVGMDDLYMFPRADGILLGGTRERGVEDLEPNPAATRRIFEGHRRIFQGMKNGL